MMRPIHGAAISLYLSILFFGGIASCTPQTSTSITRQEQIFNDSWQFHLGALDGPTALNTPEAEWKTLQLPHDWAIEGPFDPSQSGEQGKLPWQGEGWYKKSFSVTAEELNGKRVLFLFDAVMANPKVYINGALAGSWHYGYNSFWLDVTKHINEGQNQIAVHVSTLDHYSRWYPGAGIYRKVRKLIVSDVHIPIWGVKIETPHIGNDSADVNVKTELTNQRETPVNIRLNSTIQAQGSTQTLATGDITKTLAPRETVTVEQTLQVKNPQRWDVESPVLYKVVSHVFVDDQPVDSHANRFGFRTFKWTGDDGFHLNGRRLQLKGVNLHHDNGPLGAALFKDSLVRKLNIMRDMGVNALRTSHNAPSPELLELADEMGFVVIDELFDKYGPTASVQTDTPNYINNYAEAEVRNFIRRDQNHPSVVLWGVGNEVNDILTNQESRELMFTLVDYFKQYDTTRPTNMASHIVGGIGLRVLDAVETQGWNYGQKYSLTRMIYPDTPQIYTESASAFSTRGFYQFPHPKHKSDYNPNFQESSYDFTAAIWSDIVDIEFMRMERDSYVAGEFVWTGFDYLGEPTPHTKEARSSYFGIVDLVGLPKDRFYQYRADWNTQEDTIHLLPHWTWPERIGKNVPVYLYTNGDEAELFLNGKSLGKRKKLSVEGVAAQNTNLAFSKVASASSQDIRQDPNGNVVWENRADMAVDGSDSSKWSAQSHDYPQWLMVDLEKSQPLRFASIEWADIAQKMEFELQVSDDANNWTTVGSHKTHEDLSKQSVLNFEAKGRYVRVLITKVNDAWWLPSIKELVVKTNAESDENARNPYYLITDRYRLKWEDVTYQPGELKAVVYKDGKALGEQIIQTAGKASQLALAPETNQMKGDGDSLIYVQVDATDNQGRLAPHAMDKVTFEVTGPATIAGIGNGNPMGYDSFVDNTHPLFYGKAVVILRSIKGESGTVTLKASANGLASSQATMTVTH